jgi:dUTPase
MTSNKHWYELEIMPLNAVSQHFYPMALYNRTDENAGFDLRASDSVVIEPQQPSMIPFGIACRMLRVESSNDDAMCDELIKTESHFFLFPRSSIYKSGLIMANSTGVIDKSYRGELKAPVWTMTGQPVQVQTGDRYFQIVAPDMGHIRNIRLVESLPETHRGTGGFGSTGN